MNKARPKIVLGFAFVVLSGMSTAWAQETSKPEDQLAAISFSTDLEETFEQGKTSGKPVVVSFVAAWCPVCARMKRETYPDASVIALADRFLWVMVDIDRELSTARAHGVNAVPLIYLIDGEGRTRVKLLGLQTATELADHLTRFLGELEKPEEERADEPVVPVGTGLNSNLIWTPKGYRSHAICFSHVGYGPLNLYSQSPFQALRLGIRPRTPSTLGKGQYEFRGSATWVNVWATGPDYFLDFEMLQEVVALSYGVSDTFQIEGEFQNRSRFGGAMDAFVQSFHDIFGVGQNGRDEVPRGQFAFDLMPPGGQPAVSLDGGDRGTFTRSIQISLQHNVSCGTASLPAFSYSVTARLETADAGDLSGGGDLDLGASVALSRRLGRFYLYGTLGYAKFGQDRFRGIKMEGTQYTGLFAVEWRMMPRHALLIQYLRTEGLINNFGPFDDESHELTLGWKWEVVQRGVLEVGLIENLVSFDNSPDFGIHVGFSRRF